MGDRLKTARYSLMTRRRLLASVTAAAAWPALVWARESDYIVRGAGATLPARMYEKWGRALSDTGLARLQYAAIGSGQGWTQITQGAVDFAATEVPVDSAVLAQHDLLQFPVADASIVLTVNLPGLISNELQLTPAILSGIYTARIRHWRHPEILAVNPGVMIPDLAITPVSRLGRSGTTYALTQFLSLKDETWRKTIGVNAQAVWDYGLMAKGTSALQAVVARTPGSIGYQVTGRTLANHVSLVAISSPEKGLFKAPTTSVPRQAWPLATSTYALIPLHKSSDPGAQARTLSFFLAGLTSWQSLTVAAGLEPLDSDERQAVIATWQARGLSVGTKAK